jgi:hypothetical protein
MGLTPTVPKKESIVIAITPYLIAFTAASRPYSIPVTRLSSNGATQTHHQLSLFFRLVHANWTTNICRSLKIWHLHTVATCRTRRAFISNRPHRWLRHIGRLGLCPVPAILAPCVAAPVSPPM